MVEGPWFSILALTNQQTGFQDGRGFGTRDETVVCDKGHAEIMMVCNYMSPAWYDSTVERLLCQHFLI